MAQVAGLLLLAAVSGVVAGHLWWPRRSAPTTAPEQERDLAPAARSAPSALAAAVAPTASPAAGGEPSAGVPEPEPGTAGSDDVRAAVLAVTNQKDAEFGRLESGAVMALERTIASFQARVSDLEARLASSEERRLTLLEQAQDERSRSQRLAAALAERDERVADLSAELKHEH
jgi:hypothetical protein